MCSLILVNYADGLYLNYIDAAAFVNGNKNVSYLKNVNRMRTKTVRERNAVWPATELRPATKPLSSLRPQGSIDWCTRLVEGG